MLDDATQTVERAQTSETAGEPDAEPPAGDAEPPTPAVDPFDSVLDDLLNQ